MGCTWGSDLVLLWLWPRAAAPIQTLVWERAYAVGAAVKRKNNLGAMTQYLGLVNPNQILFFPFFKNDFIVMNVFVCSFVFLGPHHGTWSIQSCSCWPMPQPQECQIRYVSVTYSAACDNTRSLTHWVGSGMEPESSWTLVRFVTAEPQWEPPVLGYDKIL